MNDIYVTTPASVLPLHKLAEQVLTRDDFVRFSYALLQDLREHPKSWQNTELPTYLEALGAWISDMDGYFQQKGQPVPAQPSWRLLAEALLAARVYE